MATFDFKHMMFKSAWPSFVDLEEIVGKVLIFYLKNKS